MKPHAVCRIVSPSVAGRRGTGFLIGPGTVLTAAHVVCDPNDPSLKLEGTDVLQIAFARPSAADPSIVARGTVTEFDHVRDYAVVQLDRVPQQLRPFQLGRPRGALEYWNTFGFSHDAADSGRAYGGRVANAIGDRMQLFVDEGAAHGGIHPAGLSGSPVVVDDLVVGIVAAMPQAEDDLIPVGATLHAVPLDLVEASCPAVRVPSELPFEAPVADWIHGSANLNEALEKLGFSGDGHWSNRARAVARQMMRQGVIPATEALKVLIAALSEARTLEILNMSSSAWIEDAAIERFQMLLRDPGRQKVVLLINATELMVAEWFAMRADLYPPVIEQLTCTDAYQVRPDVLKQVAERLPCAVDEVRAAAKDQWSPDEAPLVVLLKGLPVPAEIAKLHEDLPQLRVVLAVADKLNEARALFPGGELIEPRLPDGAEAPVVLAYNKGKRYFKTPKVAAFFRRD